jgi:hypothetical protein
VDAGRYVLWPICVTVKNPLMHGMDTLRCSCRMKQPSGFRRRQPGRLGVSCHIIQHQETGMMSYLRVG